MLRSSRDHDVAFVGGGLSAAAVVYSLLRRVIASPEKVSPFGITVFEKTENLWTGVPYGGLANKDCFLIETVEETNCPLFTRWLKSNAGEVASYASFSTPVVEEWYQKNHKKIEVGDVGNLYFPRRVFGLFIKSLLENVITRVTSWGLLELKHARQEVFDVLSRPQSGFYITDDFASTADPAITSYYRQVVLAVGSIPKSIPFDSSSPSIDNVNYISDNEVCAYLDLPNRLTRVFSSSNVGKLDIVIIGSAASAIETMFLIATNQDYLDRIGRLTIVSTSGCIVGGISAKDYQENDLPDYVLLRKSSDIYISTAHKLYQLGMLKIVKGRVVNVWKEGGRYAIALDKNTEQVSLPADLIINCTGSGTVDNTSSGLINNLKVRLPINEERRGFSVDDENMVHRFPGLFLVGPLLNRSFSGKQVESISAVFREGDIVANALFRDLSGSVEKANQAVPAR